MTKTVVQWAENAYSQFQNDPSFLNTAELKDLQVMRDSIPWQINLQTNKQKKDNFQVCLNAINLQIESRKPIKPQSEKNTKPLNLKEAYNQITTRQFFIIGIAATLIAAFCSYFKIQEYLPQMISFQGPWYVWFFVFFRSVGGLAVVVLIIYNYVQSRRSAYRAIIQTQDKPQQKEPLKTYNTADIR